MSNRVSNRAYCLTFDGICCRAEVNERSRVDPDSAPVVRWAYGKPWAVLERWVLGRGGTVEVLEENSPAP